MTIAAGFQFDDGVLICADTKHVGAMALYNPKLFRANYASGATSVFAIVGNVSYAKMAVRKCESAIGKLSNPTRSDMTDAVESQLLALHKDHLFGHPDRPEVSLLFALWSPVDGLGTYYSNQTSVDSFSIYHCLGAGEYLGHYIIKPRYKTKDVPLHRAYAVACTALRRVKSYDASCGGSSQFLLMRKVDGWVGEAQELDISAAEKFSDKFYEHAESLYTSLTNISLSAADVDTKLELFKLNVNAIRTDHLLEKRNIRHLRQLEESIDESKAQKKAAGQK